MCLSHSLRKRIQDSKFSNCDLGSWKVAQRLTASSTARRPEFGSQELCKNPAKATCPSNGSTDRGPGGEGVETGASLGLACCQPGEGLQVCCEDLSQGNKVESEEQDTLGPPLASPCA